MTYRKKPVEVEAVQYLGDNTVEVADFMAGRSPRFKSDGNGNLWMEIDTPEGGAIQANRGDWIVKNVMGEFYPCNSDLFEATYEEVH